MNTIDSVPKGRAEMMPAATSPAPARATTGSPPTANSGSTTTVAALRGEELAREAARITRELADLAPHVLFSVDQESGQVVVRVLDPETRELVRQIPPQELIEIRQRMDTYLGLLADEVA